MNRTEALCKAFGWQGGTIHQVAKETGCEVHALLYAEPDSSKLDGSFIQGWFAARACTREFNMKKVFPLYRGDLDFWLGVVRGFDL